MHTANNSYILQLLFVLVLWYIFLRTACIFIIRALDGRMEVVLLRRNHANQLLCVALWRQACYYHNALLIKTMLSHGAQVFKRTIRTVTRTKKKRNT